MARLVSINLCVAAQHGEVVSHQTGASGPNAMVAIPMSVVFTLAVVASITISVCALFRLLWHL